MINDDDSQAYWQGREIVDNLMLSERGISEPAVEFMKIGMTALGDFAGDISLLFMLDCCASILRPKRVGLRDGRQDVARSE